MSENNDCSEFHPTYVCVCAIWKWFHPSVHSLQLPGPYHTDEKRKHSSQSDRGKYQTTFSQTGQSPKFVHGSMSPGPILNYIYVKKLVSSSICIVQSQLYGSLRSNFSVLTVHNDLLATCIALGELYFGILCSFHNIAWFWTTGLRIIIMSQ